MKISHLQTLAEAAQRQREPGIETKLSLAIEAAHALIEQSKPDPFSQQKVKDLKRQIRELEDPSIDVTYDDPGDEP